jgi:hypothetical protein
MPVQAVRVIVKSIAKTVNWEFVPADIYRLFHLTLPTLVKSQFYPGQEAREISFSETAT